MDKTHTMVTFQPFLWCCVTTAMVCYFLCSIQISLIFFLKNCFIKESWNSPSNFQILLIELLLYISVHIQWWIRQFLLPDILVSANYPSPWAEQSMCPTSPPSWCEALQCLVQTYKPNTSIEVWRVHHFSVLLKQQNIHIQILPRILLYKPD